MEDAAVTRKDHPLVLYAEEPCHSAPCTYRGGDLAEWIRHEAPHGNLHEKLDPRSHGSFEWEASYILTQAEDHAEITVVSCDTSARLPP